MSSAASRPCKECAAEWGGFPPPAAKRRPAPHPGPRCATHHREERKRVKAARHEKYVGNTYSLPAGAYKTLYEAQGGKCAICQIATGKARKLSVDHDHACCDGPISCGRCVRGLLCSTCNKMLGHGRDSTDFFKRTIAYLADPPAKRP